MILHSKSYSDQTYFSLDISVPMAMLSDESTSATHFFCKFWAAVGARGRGGLVSR